MLQELTASDRCPRLLPPSVDSLPQLQLCLLDHFGPPFWGGALEPPLQEGAWLGGVRWLAASATALLSGAAALEEADALEYLELLCYGREGVVDFRGPGASALLDWLADHPPLRRVSFVGVDPSQFDFCFGDPVDFPSADLLAWVAELRRRRPRLQVHCPVFGGAEASPLRRHLLEQCPF